MTMGKEIERIDRSTAGLRDSLFDCIEKVKAGSMEAADAKVVALLAKTIVDSAALQIEFEKLRLTSEIPGTWAI